MIKIPATPEGLPAITRTLADGISVNVTLIFSVQRYREVTEAFLAGLERARERGLDLASIVSVASFFVSRVDTEIDARLERLGPDATVALRGAAAGANARLAYAVHLETLGSERWAALRADGATAQRPLWASTGVKNDAYPDTLYVTGLVAPGTVNTMPEATLDAVADHGEVVGDTVTGTEDAAHDVFRSLSEVGVDIDDVYRVLEDEGVEKFADSWRDVESTVSARLDEHRDR